MAKVISSASVDPAAKRRLGRKEPDGIDQQAPSASGHSVEPEMVSRADHDRVCRDLLTKLNDTEARAEQAESRLEEMGRSLDQFRSKAREDGLRLGSEQAREASAAATKEQLDAFAQLMDELSSERKALVSDAEEMAVEIGYFAAAKVVGTSVSDMSLARGIVQQALTQVSDTHQLVLKLSELDYERIDEFWPEVDRNRRWPGLTLRVDSTVAYGGCIVETQSGSLDARLEVQLTSIKTALSEAHSRQQSARQS